MRISSIRWGVIWIGVGLFFLAINFEVMDSLVFPRLFSLWPVLLIAIGVELIFRKTKLYFLALISPLLIATAFIAAASYETGWGWNFDEFFHGWTRDYKGDKTNDVEIPRDNDIDTLAIDMNCRTADFRISGRPDLLFSAKSSYSGKSPVFSRRRENGVEYVSYDLKDKSGIGIFDLFKSPFRIDLSINNDIPVRAEIITRAKHPNIDFSDIRLYGLGLTADSKELVLWLGDSVDSVNVSIDGDIGKLTLTVPADMGVELVGKEIKLDSILGDEFTDSEDGFRSADYDNAAIYARINVEADVNSIEVERE